MKRLSLWAYHHKGAARLLIVLCYLIINLTGFLVGDLLLTMEVHLSALLVYLLAAAAGLAFMLYPLRKEKHRYRNYYLRQKACDGVLMSTTFLLVVSAANLREAATSPFHFIPAHAVAPATVHNAGSIARAKPRAKASFFKAVKSKLSHSFQKVRHYYKRLNTTDKILLTALLALLAAAALYGVIAWSCSLSCGGGEAAGWIVLIAGTGVVIFLVLWAGRVINRAYRRRQDRRAHASAG